MSQGMWWPLAARGGPQLTASKRTGTLVLQTQETEFHQQSEQIGSGFSHRAPENNVVCQCLDFSLVRTITSVQTFRTIKK